MSKIFLGKTREDFFFHHANNNQLSLQSEKINIYHPVTLSYLTQLCWVQMTKEFWSPMGW